MKTETTNTQEIEKLARQVAHTLPAREAFADVHKAAEGAQASGVVLRKGNTSRSARNRAVHVYATVRGGEECRIWTEDVMRSGYYAPLTGPKLARLAAAIRKLSAP